MKIDTSIAFVVNPHLSKMLGVFILFVLLTDTGLSFGQKVFNPEIGMIEDYLEETMDLHGIQGLAIGIIQNDTILNVGYFGDTLANTAINENTIFSTFGLTQLVTVTAIFKLIDLGSIRLEDHISIHLKNLPEGWGQIKVKHLLGNSSGIHNVFGFGIHQSNRVFLERVGKIPLGFNPGERFDFNETNYWLLGQLIESITGESLDDYVRKNILGGKGLDFWFTTYLAPNGSNVFSSRASAINDKGFLNAIEIPYARDSASNGLKCTMKRLLNWSINLHSDLLFSQKTKNKMWSTYLYAQDQKRFLHGWNVYSHKNQLSYGNTSITTSFRYFPKYDLTVIVLSTNYKYYPIQDEVINAIAGLVEPNAVGNTERLMLDLSNSLVRTKGANAEAIVGRIEENIIRKEQMQFFNSLANKSLGLGKPSAARLFFEKACGEFPNSEQAYENLTRFYLGQGLLKEARNSLKRVLELNPNNVWSKQFQEPLKMVPNE